MRKSKRKLIRFDWAIKSLLREKSNFDILEGFLGALLEDDDIKIIELLGEEGQQDDENEKFNRVDILVKDHLERRIIIEVQTTRESDYLERLLFGTSKSVIDNIGLGNAYKNIYKVISISILFFNLGRGDDYLYHGTTSFVGMNDGKPLIIKRREESVINGKKVIKFKDKNIFPEYYLIRVEKYPNIIEKKIDEWIYLIKNNEVKEGSTAKNIDKAEEKLDYLNMTEAEKARYSRFMINYHRELDLLNTAREEGEAKGQKKLDKVEQEKEIALEKVKQAEIARKKAEEAKKEAERQVNQLKESAVVAMIKSTQLSDKEIAAILNTTIIYVAKVRENISK